jgi:predicted dehydrogenase
VKFTILGSGFGLYGYLPALIVGCGQSVCLPERYRTRVEDRDDVRQFSDVITWSLDEHTALAEVDAVLVTQRPADQEKWVRECVIKPNIRAMLLEKPLARSPKLATNLLEYLEQSGKKFRIGYTFRFTSWASLLRQSCESDSTRSISIDWQFQAHHYVQDLSNWKRFVSEGGGTLRFFGIHIIGLLAEFGYDDVIRSRITASAPDECETWSAVFVGPDLPECRVHIGSRAATKRFTIKRTTGNADECLSDLVDPFAMEAALPGLDDRVGLLSLLCRDLIDQPALSYPWYRQSVRLWDKVERCNDVT